MTVPEKSPEGLTALTLRRAANLPDDTWTNERIAVIRRTCTPPGTEFAELAMFLTVANRYDLDPIMGEIWLGKGEGGKLRILTGRNTYLKVARRDPQFAGLASGVVFDKDVFTVTRDGDRIVIHHEIVGFDRGARLGAYCLVKQLDRPDVYVQRTWTQFKHINTKQVWQQYPDDMLETRCIVAALRFAYNITGMALPEEEDGSVEPEASDPAAAPIVVETENQLTKVRDRLEQMAKERSAQARQSALSETVVDAPAFDDDGVVLAPDTPAIEPGDAAE